MARVGDQLPVDYQPPTAPVSHRSNAVDKLTIALQNWTDSLPQEKVYLHMDKPHYAPGDTILYPNKKRVISSKKNDITYSPVSLLDAQLVNVYLPKDASYVQHIDPNERDRIVLVKGNSGEKITIFDFKGSTYRYGE